MCISRGLCIKGPWGQECVVVVGHQAVLRAVLGYFLATPLEVRVY